MSQGFRDSLIWGLALLAGAPLLVAAVRRFERDDTLAGLALLAMAALVVFGCLIGLSQGVHS